MSVKTFLCLAIALTALIWVACSANARNATPPPASEPPSPTKAGKTISGVVRDSQGPIQGAIVRVPATHNAAITAADGTFMLTDLADDQPVDVSAWAPGYFIRGKTKIQPGQRNLIVELAAHPTEDNPSYEWLSAFASAGAENNCENCHAHPDNTLSALPFDEWRHDAHSQSAVNPRFLTMYNGTDLKGNKSPLTRYGLHRDYGRFPLRPDSTQPYYGPGFKLDLPDGAGNCAACHLPEAAIDAPYQTDPNAASEVGREGVACDLCHKVWQVRLDTSTGLPYPNAPGVLSFEFRRPPEQHQFFAGPFDDVPVGEDTYSPLQQQSQFCAPCHYGVFWGVQVYNSFGEWLASPYANPQTGKTCQDCHMPPGKNTHFARLDKGGRERDPQTIFSHRMPGAADVDLLQNSVTMTTTVHRAGDDVIVQVSIVNDKTGHHVPTDSPLRNILLIVSAHDSQGSALVLRDGETLPGWAGDHAGEPGKGFAKVLEELWTEVSPSGAYWQATRLSSDNRLAAFAIDTSRYVFAAPKSGGSVEVKLLFRRAFYTLMKQKGWSNPDIVMESFKTTLP